MTDRPAPADGAFPRYTYAFQPIVDVVARTTHAYEALVRGEDGRGAADVFARLAPSDMHAFDRQSRCTAVRTAGRIGIQSRLSVNVLPGGLDAEGTDLRQLLEAATEAAVPPSRIILEVTEGEAIVDPASFSSIIDEYRGIGIGVAIDDFGAGYAGLNLLADFQPDIVKLDMSLVREIESRGPRQTIVRAVMMVCEDLGIDVIAEGVETDAERRWLEDLGIRLFQGYLFARPGLECLPVVDFPARAG